MTRVLRKLSVILVILGTFSQPPGGVMMKTTPKLLCVTALAAVATLAHAQVTEIKVSYQPALYWALPFYVADQQGWWAELGLKPTFSTFPAGVPQIAASASKSWDVGGTGSVPAVLGAARYNLLTIGITNDESQGNALLASGAKADGFVRNPGSIKGRLIVPGAIIVRQEYAKEQPQNVAKYLAVYLRAQKWSLANRKEAVAMMKKFYEQGGVTISEAAMNKEFDTRPVFDLAGQLKVMNRPSGGASEVDGWLTKIGEFMKANGTFAEVPAAKGFITDEYLRMVDRDPKLKEFANRAN